MYPESQGADKNWTQLIERLRVKLNAAEAALSGPEPKAVVKSSEQLNAVKSRAACIARSGTNASRTLEALRDVRRRAPARRDSFRMERSSMARGSSRNGASPSRR
jgi:hypothetical protein